jgi:hypothetical protein
MPIQRMKRIARATIRDNPDWLFVFGDNLTGTGYGGQAREARGEPNAIGVPTKRKPTMERDAFFTDADLAIFMVRARQAFSRINAHLLAGGTVVWPEDGIGTGLADLERSAPEVWRHLQLFIVGMEATAAATEELASSRESR